MAFNLADFPEAFAMPIRTSQLSEWLSHLPLSSVIVKLLVPRTFVELGTQAGDSYLGFCQAVKTLSTGTQCTAVDTWKGDPHSRAYGPEVLRDLREVHDRCYADFSRLMQTTFDQAAESIAPGSIDLLHIDGMHTYEAVRHDYDTWLPKMSDRGVIVFHDTAEHKDDFGVWKLWEEISPAYPHANLPHGHGLGLLAVGNNVPGAFLEFLAELNSRPELVRIFEAMGIFIHTRRQLANAAAALYNCQVFVEAWKQRTGRPPRMPAPTLDEALAGPGLFGNATMQEVRQMAIEAINMAAEIATLRQKPGPGAPGV